MVLVAGRGMMCTEAGAGWRSYGRRTLRPVMRRCSNSNRESLQKQAANDLKPNDGAPDTV